MLNVKRQQAIIDKEVEEIVNRIYKNKDNDTFYHKGTFNTQNLPDHKEYKYSPNIDNNFREIIFDKLNAITKNHCLYWFELKSIEKTKELNSLMDKYRKKKNEIFYKKVPASNNNSKTNILYLGVRQGGYRKRDGLTNIEGRINQHLGYYDKKTTQGLQLYEYAKEESFEITLKVVEFKGLEPYLLNVIEKLLAKKMMPISGRH